jgi:glycosyltransferase involved in cell wall biosynthesis
MRIGIDARELGRGATGVGRYLRGLLNEWDTEEVGQRHEFLLYAPESVPAPSNGRRFQTRLVPGPGRTWWEQVRLPRVANPDRLDVFFAPAYTAASGLRVPTVVAIHDVSFFAHPEWFRWREGVRRRWLTDRSAHHANTIITISDFSRHEIVERLGVPDSRIRVIPPGVHRREAGGRRSGAGDGSTPTLRSPTSDLYRILFVGSIFNRRHVPDLIKAFGRLAQRRQNALLDIVGDNRSFPYQDIPRTIAAEGLASRVRWHRYASEETLHELYEQARAFAFLSEYEGLGLPPLEALASGVPPVILDTPVARESCGDAALYVPLNDLPAVADALESALFDDGVRARVLAAAPAALGKYSWPVAARDTLRVIERAAG